MLALMGFMMHAATRNACSCPPTCLGDSVHMAAHAARRQTKHGIAGLQVRHSRAAGQHHPGAVAARRSRVSRVHAQNVEEIPARRADLVACWTALR